MSMTLIQHIELGSNQASITFSSIPATFTDLQIVISGRTTGSGDTYVVISPNNANASVRVLRGNGSNAFSGTDPNSPYADMANGSHTANTFSNTSVYIPNYRSTTTNKSLSIDGVFENNATLARQILGAALYASNTAITSVVLYAADANLQANLQFVTGTSATLYGITAGSSGGVTVS